MNNEAIENFQKKQRIFLIPWFEGISGVLIVVKIVGMRLFLGRVESFLGEMWRWLS